MEEARFSFDQEKRKKIYFKANEVCKDEAIDLFLFQYTFIQGVSNRVNYKIDQGGLIYFSRIYQKK
jgi:ABC-type transport system substrate-binding protein